MNFLIKKISKKDIDKTVDIISQVLTDDFDVYSLRVREAYKKIYSEKYYWELFKNKKNLILGAYHKNKLIGFLALKVDFGGIAFCDGFNVKKEFRNMGIGSSLLKKAEEWLVKNKYHTYYLFTETETNISFYKKRGFNLIGTFKKAWFGQDEIAMQKVLKDKPFEEIFV